MRIMYPYILLVALDFEQGEALRVGIGMHWVWGELSTLVLMSIS